MNTDDPPGVVYRCPECEFATLSIETLQTHWTRAHADEHGAFCYADVEVNR